MFNDVLRYLNYILDIPFSHAIDGIKQEFLDQCGVEAKAAVYPTFPIYLLIIRPLLFFAVQSNFE